jgi:hypothetical protein
MSTNKSQTAEDFGADLERRFLTHLSPAAADKIRREDFEARHGRPAPGAEAKPAPAQRERKPLRDLTEDEVRERLKTLDSAAEQYEAELQRRAFGASDLYDADEADDE